MENDKLQLGDKLILSGLTFYGFHGVKPEERTLGQRFVVDVDAWSDLHYAGVSDLVSDTIDYTEIYSIVKEVVEGPPHNLLESIAHHIASKTFTKFNRVSAVRVKVKKPHVPVNGQMDYLGVEIFRTRRIEGQQPEAPQPPPMSRGSSQFYGASPNKWKVFNNHMEEQRDFNMMYRNRMALHHQILFGLHGHHSSVHPDTYQGPSQEEIDRRHLEHQLAEMRIQERRDSWSQPFDQQIKGDLRCANINEEMHCQRSSRGATSQPIRVHSTPYNI